jgi:hypothetical protein
MYRFTVVAAILTCFSAPALAGGPSSDRPIVVAEEGVSVHVDRNDRDHHHHVVILRKHHDEEEHHHRVVVLHDHHDHDHDHGHDHDHDRSY